MMRKVKIIPVLPEFLDEILNIEKVSFSDPWTPGMLINAINNESTLFVAALCEDEIAGYVVASYVLDEVTIENIAVVPHFRRTGIARTLLSAIVSMVESFAQFITLEVRENNTPAISLYSSMGYEKIGLRKNYYDNPTENAILMTRKILKQEG